jgi:hypothetical protein
MGFAIDFASGIEADLRAEIAVAMMFPTLGTLHRSGSSGPIDRGLGAVLLLQHKMLADVSVGSMSLKKSKMRRARLPIEPLSASFNLDCRPYSTRAGDLKASMTDATDAYARQ